jgi:putative ABC transport system permease protein
MTSLTAAPAADWRLAAVLLVLTTVAVSVSIVARLGVGREQLTAAVRACVQLAVVSTVIAAVLASVGWSLAFASLMFAVATATSTRRLGVPARQAPFVGLAVGLGAGPVVALCLGSGVVPITGPGIVPVAGILIGGSMVAATLSGRRAFQELATQTGTYEAGLAIGLPPPDAIRLVIQRTAREALMPGIDQTRTVGLVTLPGAYVGVILGGGSAAEAGAAQVLVLVGLLAAQSVTAAVVLGLVAQGRLVCDDLASLAR